MRLCRASRCRHRYRRADRGAAETSPRFDGGRSPAMPPGSRRPGEAPGTRFLRHEHGRRVVDVTVPRRRPGPTSGGAPATDTAPDGQAHSAPALNRSVLINTVSVGLDDVAWGYEL